MTPVTRLKEAAIAVAPPFGPTHTFNVVCANHGPVRFTLVEQTIRNEHPYALSTVDMRMPPGWDRVETIERSWRVDPHLEIVICMAFSHQAWEQVLGRLGHLNEQFLILCKPFDTIEAQQFANSLTA